MFHTSKILLFNKIKHKPLLFEKIFTYIRNRPFIFPYLIDNDLSLKNNLKEVMQPINKNNNLSNNLNDIDLQAVRSG